MRIFGSGEPGKKVKLNVIIVRTVLVAIVILIAYTYIKPYL